MKEILYPLRRIHGSIYEKRLRYQRRKKLRKYLKSPHGVKAYVLGSPVYTNLGDSAILIAQTAFLRSAGWNDRQIKEIDFSEYYQDRDIIKKCIHDKQPIFGLGGGNMGNQWMAEEKFRYDLMDDLPNNPMVIFPQTIYFLPDSKKDEEYSIRYYNNRENLTMVAREKKSFDTMKKLYPKANILFTLDIVLSATMGTFGAVKQERKGVLFCIRSDVEKSVDDGEWMEIEKEFDSLGAVYRRTDMYSDCPITKENRADCVRRKMQEFCGAELVITDRLHGMVFSAITGTPCVVFSNYNHKVKGTYEWISYLPYVRYVENVEQAKTAIPELLKVKNCRFDKEPLKPYFEQLAEVVKEKCQR